MSKHHFYTSRRVNVGLALVDDKVRFNVFYRPLQNTMESDFTLGRSAVIDLNITPGTNKINNMEGFNKMLSIMNFLLHTDPKIIDLLFENYMLEYVEVRDLTSERLINPAELSEKMKDLMPPRTEKEKEYFENVLSEIGKRFDAYKNSETNKKI